MYAPNHLAGFWKCPDSVKSWNFLDYAMLTIEWIGIIPSILASILLCRLDGKTRTSLLMLRTVVICAFLTLLTNFIDDIFPTPIQTGVYEINIFLCVVWASRFLYWIFSIVGAHALLYFATYRTTQIAENLQFSFATSRNIDLIYIAGLTIYSILITIPQTVSIHYFENSCQCGESLNEHWELEVVFARVYIFFSQVFILNSLILVCCSCQIIKWVKNTPKESFYDTLNDLCFKDDDEESIRSYENVYRWSTSSMCMIPLTLTYLISFSFDTTYQFVSALGVTTYKHHGIYQQLSQTFLLMHPAIVPFVMFYYIPALRFWAVSQRNRILRVLSRGFENVKL